MGTSRLSGSQRELLDADCYQVGAHQAVASFFEGKRVVVTGATGMLGGWVTYLLARMYSERGYGPEKVLLLRSGNAQVTPIWDGLIPPAQVLPWNPATRDLEIPDADVYLHFASPASPRDSRANTGAMIDLNLNGTIDILRRAEHVKESRVLFVSSSEVYGVARGIIRESTIGLVPLDSERWIYAEAKRLGEVACRVYCESRGVNTVIVRPFHTFGPGLRTDDPRIFGEFTSAILRGEELSVRSLPSTTRTFCYAPEAAAAFLLATAKGSSGEVFNVAGSEPILLSDLAEGLTREHLPRNAKVSYGQVPSQEQGSDPIRGGVPDTRRIRELGWTSPTDALGAFRRTIAFLRAGSINIA